VSANKTLGWFEIPGVQRGERELNDQLMGLRPALAEARDNRVLDLGSAEGLISRAMLEAGAVSVECVELNDQYIAEARRQLNGLQAVIHRWDLNDGLPSVGGAEIVLMLAILHKLKQPLALLSQVLEVVKPRLIVIRYPRNCDGVIVDGRSEFKPWDVAGYLGKNRYRQEAREMGPRRELTVYYRRKATIDSRLTTHDSRN